MKQTTQWATLIFFFLLTSSFACTGHNEPPTVVIPLIQPTTQTNQPGPSAQPTAQPSASDKTADDKAGPSKIATDSDKDKNSISSAQDNSGANAVVPPAGAAAAEGDETSPKKDIVAAEANVPGTPAANAAEVAASTGIGKAVQPSGSKLSFTAEDEPRIQYYKLFVAGTLGSNDVVRLLFKDSNFNRAVEVMGDLYRQDKLTGNISPDSDVRFQELGQKVGNAVLIYNQRKRSAHYSKLVGSVVLGTLIGGVAGGVLVKDEWVPEIIRTKMGDRIPGYVRNGLISGAASGTTVLITMEAYRVINEFAHPSLIYNADPLLDMPSTR